MRDTFAATLAFLGLVLIVGLVMSQIIGAVLMQLTAK